MELSPTFLNTWITNETNFDQEWYFQQFGKQDSFRNILKSSANMVESLDSLEPPLEYNQDQMPLMNKG